MPETDAVLAKAGDEGARARLLAGVEPLIRWWMSRVRWAGDWEDGLQEGRVGVLEALRRFDPERGAKFSTWAGWWIRRAIESAMRRSPLPVEEVLDVESGEDVPEAAAAAEVAEAAEAVGGEDALLLRWRFYEDQSLEEIGKRLGIHKFSASLRVDRALARVRGAMRGAAR